MSRADDEHDRAREDERQNGLDDQVRWQAEAQRAKDADFPQHPDGATCADCASIARCTWLISVPPTNTTCDWSPSRFVKIGGAR